MTSWTFHKFSELPSTNSHARELLQSGKAENGDVFQVEHQSAGRGRLGERRWEDEPGTSVLMSIVLKDLPQLSIELAPYIAALSIAYGIRTLLQGYLPSFSQTRVKLKWPNDVMLDGKKFCGILSEAVWSGAEAKGVVLGVGLNVNQARFPAELSEKAISLFQVTGRALVIDEVRDRVLRSLRNYLERARALPPQAFRASVLSDLRIELSWMALLPPFGVELATGEVLSNVGYAGIAEDGGLVARTEDGGLRRLYGATLKLPPVPGST